MPDTQPQSSNHKEFNWFDRPESKKLLWILLWAICGLTLVLEFFISKEHPHFPIEKLPFFHAILGFLACLGAILVAKGLGFFLKVKEDYYDTL